MELTANQVGMILHGMYMSDYFETEDLEDSLQQLINDKETTIGISIQADLINLYTLLEEIDFEERIPDFNERQRAFGIIRDFYRIIQDREIFDLKKDQD
ncbi:hypothetical protein [Enterococcus rivorum]|uniref:Uncharacterized protein n=1 Tax=Enterococcus rivorum TaxID=762845 RepID=A0A1E5L0H7_9ENTE|nr:hypothetical protein [Enterococcus rivorum]MBP2098854.1 hypothetical protein [Enterococcus rivorum]OEH83583.1 hypothetical protein BCR26_08885 [Enterococcus rivorum]